MHTHTQIHAKPNKPKRSEGKQSNCDLLFEFTHTHTRQQSNGKWNGINHSATMPWFAMILGTERATHTHILGSFFAKCIRCIFLHESGKRKRKPIFLSLYSILRIIYCKYKKWVPVCLHTRQVAHKWVMRKWTASYHTHTHSHCSR